MTVVEATAGQPERAQIVPLSVEAYHALGDLGLIQEQTELLYGQIFKKMSKSPLHTGLAMRLLRLLQACLPEGCHLRPEQPLTCLDSEPEPDLAVVKGRPEEYWNAHPTTAELVIEVCVTSHELDRSKLRAYASAGVKEVWLVLAPEQQIEVHRSPSGGQFAENQILGPGGQVRSAAVPQLAVDLAALFARE